MDMVVCANPVHRQHGGIQICIRHGNGSHVPHAYGKYELEKGACRSTSLPNCLATQRWITVLVAMSRTAPPPSSSAVMVASREHFIRHLRTREIFSNLCEEQQRSPLPSRQTSRSNTHLARLPDGALHKHFSWHPTAAHGPGRNRGPRLESPGSSLTHGQLKGVIREGHTLFDLAT